MKGGAKLEEGRSMEWWQALTRDGANVDLTGFLARWRERTSIYQQLSRKYWLYP